MSLLCCLRTQIKAEPDDTSRSPLTEKEKDAAQALEQDDGMVVQDRLSALPGVLPSPCSTTPRPSHLASIRLQPKEVNTMSVVFAKVKDLLQSVAELHGAPIEQLQQACTILSEGLFCQLVSVSLLHGGQPVTVCSAGEASLAARCAPAPTQCSTEDLFMPSITSMQAVLASQDGLVVVLDGTNNDSIAVPSDWRQLHEATGYLTAFAAVPVVRAGACLGMLTAAGSAVEGWDRDSILDILSAVATFLSQHYESPQVVQLADLVVSTASANSVEELVSGMATRVQEHMKSQFDVRLHARVALLPDRASAVVYERRAIERTSPDNNPFTANSSKLPKTTSGAASSELINKIQAIRKSTALSSLQDFRTLATAITKNDDARDLFTRESSIMAGHTRRFSYAGGMRYSLTGSASGSSTPIAGGSPFGDVPVRPRNARRQSSLSPRGALGDSMSGYSKMFFDVHAHSSGELRRPSDLRASVSGHEDRLALAISARKSSGLGPLRAIRQHASTSFHARFSNGGSSPLDSANDISAGNGESAALNEDVILQMVHAVDDDAAAAVPMQLVAHPMRSLDKTLLQSVLDQDTLTTQDKGTWISDMATYMMQPNRPGKDIVISSQSPSVASLVLACMEPVGGGDMAPPAAAAMQDRFSQAGTQSPMLHARSRRGSYETPGDRSSMQAPSMQAAGIPTVAVYLTSASTLTPLQLNNILRELNCVLGLISPVATRQLTGALTSELSSLFASLLAKADDPQSPFPGQSKRNARKSTSLLNMSSSMHSLQKAPSSTQLSGTGKREPVSLNPELNKSGGGWGGTLYSRESIKPQVAPLIAGMQDRLRGLIAKSTEVSWYNRHLDLPSLRAEVLVAHGGFGSVFQGSWHGLDVAIKVVPQRSELTDSVREAVEIAVMSTVSHPNLLGLQNYWADVLVTSGPMKTGESRPNGLLKLESATERPKRSSEHSSVGSVAPPTPSKTSSHHRLARAADEPVPRCLVIVMELCDQGSLEDAIHRAVFRYDLNGVQKVDMLAVLTTVLEIAMALRHMHSMQLVHCDLKPANVLLKSSMTDTRGFCTKLCDFGLVKIQSQADSLSEVVRRTTFTGTVTHAPPEMLKGDPHPTTAYDIYALGIIMWELTSTKPVYAGLADRAIAQQVVYNHLRPEFPPGFDPAYVDLAKACWAGPAASRPTADQVINQVGSMLVTIRDRIARMRSAQKQAVAAQGATQDSPLSAQEKTM